MSHVKGHIAANYIDSDLKPPYLCLLASGGHTAIVKVEDYEHIELIAQSRDDACGEAFDKVAKSARIALSRRSGNSKTGARRETRLQHARTQIEWVR